MIWTILLKEFGQKKIIALMFVEYKMGPASSGATILAKVWLWGGAWLVGYLLVKGGCREKLTGEFGEFEGYEITSPPRSPYERSPGEEVLTKLPFQTLFCSISII